MQKSYMVNIKRSVKILIFFTILLGVIYPASLTLIGRIFFPHQVNGSLLYKDAEVIGSKLIGQEFTDPKYFRGRPSATTPFPYNAAASKGSNLGPLNPELFAQAKKRIVNLEKTNPKADTQFGIDLITTSGSGLDPHISLRSAFYQLHRIAAARRMDYKMLHRLVYEQVQDEALNMYGTKIVNVLQLNLALDALEMQLKGKKNDNQTH